MSDRNEYNYFDLDNFDEDLSDSRAYRRRQPQRRQGTYNGRPVYSKNYSSGKRRPTGRNPRKMRKRTRNRIIIVAGGILIFAILIFLLGSALRGCSGSTESAETISTSPVTEPGATTAPATQPASSAANSTDELSPAVFNKPDIEDDKSTGYLSGGVYYWKNTAFELFGSDDDRATNYANTINGMADKLGDSVKVYDMVIPNHTEMGLPERIKTTDVTSTSQADNIKAIYSKLAKNVTPVNAYNYLSKHSKDYIYFNSDHHWSGLGAYYAYSAFADTLKLPVLDLEACTEQKIEGFTGTLSNADTQTDTVSYWEFPYDVTMEITDANGNTQTYDSPYYTAAEGGSLTYGVFIMGDNPKTVLKSSSPDAEEGRKILVVKESYGNAFVPYLTNDFEEVHIADLRTFPDNLATYCMQNDIGEVLFLNGVMSANTQIQLDSMEALLN